MSLLAPLGLLGLLGIVALIIIYIIKPNYQNKFISSTFIWKLSLKYKKKKIPINKLRNILLFICQVAIISGAAFILAKPFVESDKATDAENVILIIDASASMQTQTNLQTRLERAANAALTDAKTALKGGKSVSIILASDESSYLIQEASSDQASQVYDVLKSIINTPDDYYTFGSSDIDGAMKLAEQITSYKEDTSVTLYTDTNYLNAGNINIHNVAEDTEWNAAILDVRATKVDGLFRIEIDVACYGINDQRISVNCEIFNVNGTGENLPIELDAYCINNEVTTLVLAHKIEDMSQEEKDLIDEEITTVLTFDQIYVQLSEEDSFSYDNQFYLYGGTIPTIKIQLYSANPNTYWRTVLDVLADAFKDKWILDIVEIKPNINEKELKMEGFDIYIFEHNAPNTIPSDGIVIYSNTPQLPADAGIRYGSLMQASNEIFLSPGEKHPITTNIIAEKISVTQFMSVISSDGYTPLLCFEEHPLLLVKDDVDQKIVLMPFSVHYSNLVALPEFPLLLNNIINHFFKPTIEEFVYEPGDTVSLNARAETLDVIGPETELTFDELPAELSVSLPGIYTLTQVPISGMTVIENFFVKIPESESNIIMVEETLTNPYFFEEEQNSSVDLLFYFALAVVVLLFLEWWLKSREQI